MVHMFWYVLHVALDKAWCPPGAAGDEPDTGLGLLQNLPLSHKAESTACPQLPGGKRGWYPMTSLNQHPPVSSELLPSRGGEDEEQNKSRPALVMEFGGKFTLFYPLAWEKHWWAPCVPRGSLAQGLWPCSHVGREEEEVVPTLTHRMDTLKKPGIASVERGS